ncbi:MAG: lysozyme [Bacteroidales bacterium]|nr:lysozyme [Bacteroidales bacterium]
MHRRVGFLIAIVVTSIVAVCGFIHAYRQYIANSPAMDPDHDLYPIRGIDISAHNGDIDFDRVKSAGYDFAIIKATEGTDFKDAMFVDNVRRARNAGLKVGAYHFFRFDTDGELQAINLLHSLRNRSLDFPIVIDIEQTGNPEGHEPAAIAERLRAMLAYLEREGADIMLYSNKDDYNRYLKGNFRDYPLWLCSFTLPEEELDWTLWQYSHRGNVDGVKGKVDLNTIKSTFYRSL